MTPKIISLFILSLFLVSGDIFAQDTQRSGVNDGEADKLELLRYKAMDKEMERLTVLRDRAMDEAINKLEALRDRAMDDAMFENARRSSKGKERFFFIPRELSAINRPEQEMQAITSGFFLFKIPPMQ